MILILDIIFLTVGGEVIPRRTFIVSGLRGGQAYDIKVTAFNTAGATFGVYTITTPSDRNSGK